MRNSLSIALILFTVIFSSCSHVYTPALYHQDIVYQPKPASYDSVKAQTYISAGGNIYSNTNYTDGLVSGQLNISQGYVFNHFNLAYGAFGVAGNYSNSHSTDSASQRKMDNFSDKFFGAVGGRVSANLFVNNNRFDFRYIGFEAVYSHEFGSFANFRKSYATIPYTDVDPRTDLFTVGLTSEILFHNVGNTNFQNGIRGFLGGTFGRYDLDYAGVLHATKNGNYNFFSHLFPKASYFIKYKQYFGTVEVGNGFFARFGLQF
jgi:hypothetical protein